MSRFSSIVWGHAGETATVAVAPEALTDLNLDQIFAAAGGELHAAVHRRPLSDVSVVRYRHEVFADLADDAMRAVFDAFVAGMRSVRKHLERAGEMKNACQRDRWQLDGEAVYVRTLEELHNALHELPLRATGLLEWRAWLDEHLNGAEFREFADDGANVRSALESLRYTIHVQGRQVVVGSYAGQSDYSEVIANALARLRPVNDPRGPRVIDPWPDMNEVEEQILATVADRHPREFRRLAQHARQYREVIDATVARFDLELRFYLDYLRFVQRLERHGARFCYPEVTADFAGMFVEGGYDLALANTLAAGDKTVVTNDFRLDGAERMLVVTGPNQGGKSTFGRMFGQLTYLAALGCLVPGSRARVMLSDGLFTHFVREDDANDPDGALAQELLRLHEILNRITPHSIVILNESLSTTTAADAALLGGEVVRRIVSSGAVAVFVTFVGELAEWGPEVVSMVAGIESDDDPVRTFRIERRPPDGLTYAAVVAQRHGLTYEAIRERVR
ncbi:MutS-related protein [Nocardia wallacei]|uniref:MutS-related protein n=1 Tax=Nocardia wallacei TaxID=480035 RepID=UPI002455083B|nr:DNA mismatch repair protein MutS [Nocardia wallacei]